MGRGVTIRKTSNKIAAVALSLMLAVGCAPAFPRIAQADSAPLLAASAIERQAGDYDISWYTDNESPYRINGVKQLKGLSRLVNEGVDTFEGKTIQLRDQAMAAIVFLGDSIEPIGTREHPFNGTFDGRDTVIANLTLDFGSRLSDIGLFGYAGDEATVKNVRLQSGAIDVRNADEGKRIDNVGAIAGHLGGDLAGCTSSVAISVTNDGSVPAKAGTTSTDLCTITDVGGLVGSLGGDLKDCTHGSDGVLRITSTANVSDAVPYIAGFVGGLVGFQGIESDASHVTNAANCTNAGSIVFEIDGSGGVDRFGAQTYSKSSMVGGIVGYAMGNVSDCKNTAAIQTGVVDNGAVQAGWGASTVGAIVGSLRGPTIAESASTTGVVGSNSTDPGYTVWADSQGTREAEMIAIERCSNTGDITGLASVGGIAGSTGAFTKVIGCSNAGRVEGTRWNKPCPAGIVGISNGDVAYCYNQGRCLSTTGGGYYASGITALLTTYNTSSTADALRLPVPELYGCYVTGQIGGESSGFRTAVLAGENDGFIHDNCFLPDLAADKATDEDGFSDGKSHSRLVSSGENRGTLRRNHELSVDQMRTSLSSSLLNAPVAKVNDWSLHYVPVAGEFPVLSWQHSVSPALSISLVASGIEAVDNPEYSAALPPIPQVTLATRDGSILYQNADYRVEVDANTAGKVGGTHEGVIVGMNGYSGRLPQKASYTIVKADIGNCTVSAQPAVFNWERQLPDKTNVTVFDDAGNIVDPAEYDIESLANDDFSTVARNGRYYDYVNCHGQSYFYDVKVRASETSSHFVGESTQAAFRIKWASLFYSAEDVDDPNKEESAVFGNVVYGGQEWDIRTAIKNKGHVKVKYTGQPITPTVKSVTYLGKNLRNGTNEPYYYHPLDYDYLYVYGNPNPENGADFSSACVNATGSDPQSLACMTVRFTPGGNFDNYTNVFFEIVPADISDVSISGIGSSYLYSGSPVEIAPTLTYNGMTLVKDRDYTISYSGNDRAGDATATITCMGNYRGSTTYNFKVAKRPQPLTVKAAKKTLKKSALKKKAKKIAPIKAANAEGALKFKNASKKAALKKFKVSSKGKITVPKGTKKGTYKVVVKVTASGNERYEGGSKTVTVVIKVK